MFFYLHLQPCVNLVFVYQSIYFGGGAFMILMFYCTGCDVWMEHITVL